MPAPALAALREQLDLREVEINPGVVLFQTGSAWPLRSNVTDLDLPADGAPSLEDQLSNGWAAPPAVLGVDPGTTFSGTLQPDQKIAQSVTADPGWQMKLDSGEAPRTDLFGWSQQFNTAAGGSVTLEWVTPLSLRVLQLVQVLGLLGLLVLAIRNPRMFPRSSRRSAQASAGGRVVVGPDGLRSEATTATVAGSAIQGVDASSGPHGESS
ncbi:unannotated protein [freshwater metagenome]|nr:hypothetical protein [Actinomycetota bacterium]